MIRTRHFYRQIGIAALALSGLLGLGADSALAQQGVDGLPCSTRRTTLACMAECDDTGGGNYLFDCTRLFDNGVIRGAWDQRPPM